MPASVDQYDMNEDEPALRGAVTVEARAPSVPCEAGQVLIASGSQQTLDLASGLSIDPGIEVLLKAPTCLTALQAFQLFGADCVTIPLGVEDPDLVIPRQRLGRHKSAFAYLISTFQNPSGVRYNKGRRDAMTTLLDEFGVTLIEDEPYRELVFDEGRVTPLVSRLRKSSWICAGTVSKTLLPGLRVGLLITTLDLFPYLLRLKQSADLHTNRVGQWQALQWFGNEAYRQHLAELREFYRVHRDTMQEAMLGYFGELAEWNTPEGRLFFWLTLRQPLDTRTLLQPALAADIAFMPGEPFFTEPEQNLGHLRLNFGHVAPGRLHGGLRRLAKVVRDTQVAETA